MIPRKRRACAGCNTPQFIFSNNLCSNCYGRNRAKLERLTPKWGVDAPGERKSLKRAQKPLKTIPKPIKPRSDRRKLEEMRYKAICLEIDAEAKESGDLKCWFCGKDVEDAQHHHAYGRVGNKLVEKKDIHRVHPLCHDQYHHSPVESIPWHRGFMGKLLWEDMALLYNIEREKYNKSAKKHKK